VIARIEHACLHGANRYPDDLGDLIDRFLVVVDEVEHFAMARRKLGQAFLNHCGTIPLLQKTVRIVRGVLDQDERFFIQRLVATAAWPRSLAYMTIPLSPLYR
jgi:hypothetical protein